MIKYEEICRKVIYNYGEKHQLEKLVEECAELIVAIKHQDKHNIAEEIADVTFLIDQLTVNNQKLLSEIGGIQLKKAVRQINRINEENK